MRKDRLVVDVGVGDKQGVALPGQAVVLAVAILKLGQASGQRVE